MPTLSLGMLSLGRDVAKEDLWAFFRFCVLMGINKLPAIHHYWSTDPLLRYSPIADGALMPSSAIPQSQTASAVIGSLPSCGFCTSPIITHTISHPPPDRLYKVHPMLDTVVAACWTNWEQAIGEAMVAVKGRSSMKQYR